MVQFDSVDPAALVVAIIAVIVSFEQLARAAFDSQTKRMKRIVIHLLRSSDFLNTSKITDLDDDEFLLLVELGLRATTFQRNGKHPAIYSVFRIWPSSLFMGQQAWCIRRNFGIGAFTVMVWSYFVYGLPWVWYFYYKEGGQSAWSKNFYWRYNNHNSGYSGKQFDMCIEHLFYQLDGTMDVGIRRLLLKVAHVASSAESKYIGPCVTSQIACGQEVSFGALLCDIKLLDPQGHLGIGIRFDPVWNAICVVSLHNQSYMGTLPVFDDIPGIKNIVRYYGQRITKDQDREFYNNHVTKIFLTYKLDNMSSELPSIWCSINCESLPTKKCIWRGRPILIMTEEELISLAASGRLNKLKCLVTDRRREKLEIDNILKENNCDIDTVFEQTVGIDHIISRLREKSFVILASSLRTGAPIIDTSNQ